MLISFVKILRLDTGMRVWRAFRLVKPTEVYREVRHDIGVHEEIELGRWTGGENSE